MNRNKQFSVYNKYGVNVFAVKDNKFICWHASKQVIFGVDMVSGY